jgi:tetratricopeptide (TPR) repeat protein
VSVWFDFPKQHVSEYRKVVPQLQMPWIEDEFARHMPVFHRHGLGWSVTSVISERPYSDAEVMPDAVLAEMLKQLYRQLKEAQENHRHMVVQLFNEAQPHIDRRLNDLEARKGKMPAGDYLREVGRLATDLSDLGGKRSARKLLSDAFSYGIGELEPAERLEIGTQLAGMMREDDDARGAIEVLRRLVSIADELPDSHPKKLAFFRSLAASSVDMFAYDIAVFAYGRAIDLSKDVEKEELRAQLAELHYLLGNLEEAIKVSSED